MPDLCFEDFTAGAALPEASLTAVAGDAASVTTQENAVMVAWRDRGTRRDGTEARA